MHTIYVVKCYNDRYIVGRTNTKVNIGTKLMPGEVSHNGFFLNSKLQSTEFLNKYPEEDVIDVIKSDDPLDLDKITKKYMLIFGIDKVRGGSYSSLILDDWMIKALENEFNSNNEKPEENSIKLTEYLDKFTNLSMIDDEITYVKNIYIKIINLNKFIEYEKENDIGIKIGIELVTNLKNEALLESKERAIAEAKAKLPIQLCTKNGSYLISRSNRRPTKLEVEIEKYLNNIDGMINNTPNFKYSKIFTPYNNKISLELKLLEAINFILELKNELKEIYKIHESKEAVENKLNKLYWKKMELLEKKLISDEQIIPYQSNKYSSNKYVSSSETSSDESDSSSDSSISDDSDY